MSLSLAPSAPPIASLLSPILLVQFPSYPPSSQAYITLILTLLTSTCNLLELAPSTRHSIHLGYLSLLSLRATLPPPPSPETTTAEIARTCYLPLPTLLSLLSLYSRSHESDRRQRDLINAACLTHLLPGDAMPAVPAKVEKVYRAHWELTATKITVREEVQEGIESSVQLKTRPDMVDDVGSDVPLPSLTPKSTFWHYRIPHTPPTLLLRLFNHTLPASVLLEALVGMVYSMDVIGASQEDPNGGEWCGSKVVEDEVFREGWALCNAVWYLGVVVPNLFSWCTDDLCRVIIVVATRAVEANVEQKEDRGGIEKYTREFLQWEERLEEGVGWFLEWMEREQGRVFSNTQT